MFLIELKRRGAEADCRPLALSRPPFIHLFTFEHLANVQNDLRLVGHISFLLLKRSVATPCGRRLRVSIRHPPESQFGLLGGQFGLSRYALEITFFKSCFQKFPLSRKLVPVYAGSLHWTPLENRLEPGNLFLAVSREYSPLPENCCRFYPQPVALKTAVIRSLLRVPRKPVEGTLVS